MTSLKLYNEVCKTMSTNMTYAYSTSFSMGIRLFEPAYRAPICAIYGFVRIVDEIVDTFHHIDKAYYLETVKNEVYQAIENKISINPILHAFQQVVHEYQIDHEYIDAFLHSMSMDIEKKNFSKEEYDIYIYGSAEVVGLMCLKVFVKGRSDAFETLKYGARKLGSAFQKINFLRDIGSDHSERGRFYFPGIHISSFNEQEKHNIEEEIRKEFEEAYLGIKGLPMGSRLGVYVAYRYYMQLLNRLTKVSASNILKQRFRVSDTMKIYILVKSIIMHRFRFI
ncbi:MAG: phytoene/squalene synthase family protein [Saprospiraceae bacterium]|jgi:phytoene synthase|nr:phytoene/squalene synthase family protein [Saprospiraceae bacterium]